VVASDTTVNFLLCLILITAIISLHRIYLLVFFCVRDLRYFRQCYEDLLSSGISGLVRAKLTCTTWGHERKCMFRLVLTLGADVGDVWPRAIYLIFTRVSGEYAFNIIIWDMRQYFACVFGIFLPDHTALCPNGSLQGYSASFLWIRIWISECI